MMRVKTGKRAFQINSENPVNNCVFNRVTAFSLSIAAVALLGAGSVSASDVPLPIRKIALNGENQIVVYFGKREGEFPSPPHLLETPGPNHRIVLEFNDATVDKVNMPAAADLSTKLHKQLAAIKSIRYGTVTTGETPKARVVIEVPEQLKVRPRVVKLEEESVTINLGDDIVEQSAAIEEQTKGHLQSAEPVQTTVATTTKAEEAAATEPVADMVGTEGTTTTSSTKTTTNTSVASASAAEAQTATAVVPTAAEPDAVPSAKTTVATAVTSASDAAPLRGEEQDAPAASAKVATQGAAKTAVIDAAAKEAAANALLPSEAASQVAESMPSSPKSKAEKADSPLSKRMPESLANASANLKKFMRWPHKGDAANEPDKSATAKKEEAKVAVLQPVAAKSRAPVTPAATVPAATAISAANSPESATTATAPGAAPEGAEFNAAFASDKSAPTAVAEADVTKDATTAATGSTPAAPPGSWDWTSAAQASPAPAKKIEAKAESVVAEAKQTAAPASLLEAVQTPVSAAVNEAAQTSAVAASTAADATTPVASTPAVNRSTIAQLPEYVPDDRPKISTPIETTETHTFSEPAQMLTPGSSTSVTPAAAEMMQSKKPAEKKILTVADTDAADFADALKPSRKPAKTEVEAAVPVVPLIRDTEMAEGTEKTETKAPEVQETATAEVPKAPAVDETPVADNGKAALALYNSAVNAHLHGNLAKAIQDYKGALAVNPELAEAHSNLGLIYNQQHNYAVAVSEFRKALAINPKDAITYNGIGAALRAQRDLQGAIKNWQTAVTLDPKLATAHYNLGVAYELQKDYDKALSSYDQATKCDYRLGEAFYREGLIMQRRHRNDEAKAKYKAALKASQDSDYSADARTQLALLEKP